MRNPLFRSVWSFFFAFLFLASSPSFAVYNVVCQDPSDCPGWVAGLSHEKGVCSSFLVTPQIIATNLHCIPEDLRREKASCQGRLIVSFPKTSRFPEQKVECEEMVHLSPPIDGKSLTPDFAFFRMKEKVSREVLEISQSGFVDGAVVTLYKVDPGPQGGTVIKAQCPAVMNSLFNPYYNNEKSPLVSLIPCPVIRGNSGSALVGGDGKAHGIVFSIFDVQIPMDPALSGRADKMGVAANGSNFACLNTFFLGYNLGDPPACLIPIDEESKKKYFQSLLKTRQDHLLKELNDKVQSILSQFQKNNTQVQWQVLQKELSVEESRRGVGAHVVISPKCRVDPASAAIHEAVHLLAVMDVDAVNRPRSAIEESKEKVSQTLPLCSSPSSSPHL